MDWLRGILNQAFAAFKAMTAAQRASMVMLALTIVFTLGVVAFLGARPKFVTLASGLEQTEMQDVVRYLDETGEEYQTDPAKGAVLVHQDRKPALLGKTIRAGVISREKVYDIEDYRANPPGLGVSNAERRQLRNWALAGELKKMLVGLEGVEDAKVTIKPEDDEGFILAPERVGVAISVTTRRSVKLDQPFANSIIDLVNNAVRYSDPQQISVVDARNPRRTFKKEDPDSVVVIGARRLDLTSGVERHFKRMIQQFIRETGFEGVVNVTCELNLKKVEESAYKVLGEETVQVSLTKRKSTHKGALGPSGQVGTGRQDPRIVAGAGAGTSSGSKPGQPSESKEDELQSLQDYSRVLTETVGTPGTIKRLSLSVMLFHRVVQQKDADTGKLKEVFEEPSAKDKKEWERILANMVKVVEEPEKNVNVVVAHMKPDRPDPLAFIEPVKTWQDHFTTYKPAARIGGLFLLAAFGLFFLYGVGKRAATTRPVMTAAPGKGGPAAEEAVDIEPPEPEDVEFHEIQKRLRSFVESDPRKVAGLVKRWLVREG